VAGVLAPQTATIPAAGQVTVAGQRRTRTGFRLRDLTSLTRVATADFMGLPNLNR
jgi:hypothetical protein